MTIQVSSPAFRHEERIPQKFTGEGSDVSPALAWTNVPPEAKSLVLICAAPDAPTAEPWVHWVIASIAPTETGLPEGVPRVARPKSSAGAVQGKNSWQEDNLGYRGPLPPKGHGLHHYHFVLYALDADVPMEPGLTKNEVLKRIKGHVLAQGRLTGTYSR